MKDVTIVIKTLDRYYCLKPLVKSIIKKYPNSTILIGDDGIVTCKKQIEKDFKGNKKIKVYELPYDCGLSYGRNFLVSKVKTKYFCLCDDDFIFDKKTDLESALKILKKENLDIIGGYMRNYKIINSYKDYIIRLGQKILHYELPTNYMGNITINDDEILVDYKIKYFPEYEITDIVHNFFIAKTDSLKKCGWDNDLKLQEHTAFFYQAKLKGLKIAFTNKLSMRHCPVQNFKYKNFRTRNYTHVFMEKENIKRIVSTYDNKENSIITELPKVDNIFISVIVPVYNIKNKIDLLIKSLMEQTYKNFEVILVDNNSKDGSYDYVKSLIKNDTRFKLYREKKQGPNYARKKGFDHANGDYIYFCDSDDYLEDDTLYHFACEITKNNSDIVIGNYIEHAGKNRKLMKGIFQDYTGNLKEHKDILHVKPALWNKIFKRELIDNDSFIFTLIGEDMFITVLAMMRAKKITNIDKVVYHYILEENGLSSKISFKNITNMIETQNQTKEKLVLLNKYENWKEEVDYIFLTHTIYRIFRSTLLKDKTERKESYKLLNKHLNNLSKNNGYLKKSKVYSIAYKVVNNKFLYFLASPFIKMLFTNKILNKLFKKLDR